MSPVWWANFGRISAALARRTAPPAEPVLIVSHPRSGSSWVGRTLGRSPCALYLHEPLTLTHLRDHPGPPAFAVPPADLRPDYVRSAAAAAIAWPRFAPAIVPYPSQWRLRDRQSRRLVVKEVNPLALAWLQETFRPRIIYLIRHPAGVAASFAARGWVRPLGQAGFERRFGPAVASGAIRPELYAGSKWRELGAVQGLVHKAALAALRQAPAAMMIVRYEELCLDPIVGFRRLFDFAGLHWSPAIERTIGRESYAEAHDRNDAYAIVRNSRLLAQAWRRELGAFELAELQQGYLSIGVPFYSADEW